MPSAVETNVLHNPSHSSLGRSRPAAPAQAADPFAQLLEDADGSQDRPRPDRADPVNRSRNQDGRPDAEASEARPRVNGPGKKEKTKSDKGDGKADATEAKTATDTTIEVTQPLFPSTEDICPQAVTQADAATDPLALPTDIPASEAASALPVPTAVVAVAMPVAVLVSSPVAPATETSEVAAIILPAAAAMTQEPSAIAAPAAVAPAPAATPTVAAEVSPPADIPHPAPAKPVVETTVVAKATADSPAVRSETPAVAAASTAAENPKAADRVQPKAPAPSGEVAAKPQRPEPPAADASIEPNTARPAAEPAANIPVTHTAGVHSPATAPVAQASAAPAAPGASAAVVPVEGLALEIAARAQSGKNHFQIRLDPPELGRIDVRLDVDHDGNVTSRLVVERVETLDLLRRDAPNLERAFQQAGLKTSDHGLQFSLRDQSFSHRDQPGEMPAMARVVIPDDKVVTLETQRTYGRLAGLRGGVDIRV